ncbi:NAD(P)-dependent oxidoreductase [Agrococcus sp. Marseille-Q4369]|uniref:NAD(P)-dependent oxidoreductase n=1 Tax=Agrococcus sp. Marseille-Q4369 TaxID=2810513 RepID=UPI001B8A8D84|nr:NAD(P)-dependent oxidoreductase [Agrococcus sp. Marseille-Q4369]QUW18596.1 NAD(P)-dependent oxidoreductase [Agrococcus sp. Marseille-Q4369]
METAATPSPRDETLGVIGIGAMGEPMVRRLLAAGRSTVVSSRSPRPALVEAGAAWAASPRELAERAATVLSMLPDLPELDAALAGPDGLLAGLGDDRELLVLVGSTSSPTGVRELAARLAAATGGRVRVVDAPVSGGVDGAEAGSLSIMLGGEPADAARATAMLAPCGRAVHLGPLGAGEVAKACNQLVVAATISALGEATVLAERSGLDLDALWELLGGGYAGSNLLESRRDRLVRGDDSPSGIARYLVKDLGFAADVAEATGTNPALLPALRAFFDEIVERGHGERDISVTRRVIAER